MSDCLIFLLGCFLPPPPCKAPIMFQPGCCSQNAKRLYLPFAVPLRAISAISHEPLRRGRAGVGGWEREEPALAPCWVPEADCQADQSEHPCFALAFHFLCIATFLSFGEMDIQFTEPGPVASELILLAFGNARSGQRRENVK